MRPRARAVFAALLPSDGGGGLKLGLLDAGFEEFLAEFRTSAPLPLRLAFPAAVFAAAWLSPLLIGRLPPFTRLSAEDREAALAAMGRSDLYLLRQLLLLLKLVAGLCYGADARVRAAVGAR